MRIWLVGLPHTITHKDFLGCAFTGHIMRMGKGLVPLGHEVYHLGNPGSELVCTEHIDVVTPEFVKENLGDISDGDFHSKMYADRHLSDEAIRTFHIGVSHILSQRVQKDDYVLLNYGAYVSETLDVLKHLINKPIFVIEDTIGYLNSWEAPYKVFESDAVRSWTRSQWNQNWTTLANQGQDVSNMPKYAVHECTPQWTDDTINTFADVDLFDYKEDKKDFFLYLGRLIPSKGIKMAVDVCERLGEKLVIAGHGNLLEAIGRDKLPACVEFVGHADAKKRTKLMSEAKGGWVCTYYSEHGGNVIHEFGLSGTPVIATNWGSFTHSVLHNITGYLIQDGAEAEWAAKNIDKIKSYNCRKWQMNYTIERTIPKFIRYFERIRHIYYNGQDAFGTYTVDNLDHRQMIHPYDMNYDIDLKPVKV